MTIEAGIIRLDADDFTIGKMTHGPGMDELFILDTGRMEIIQFKLTVTKTVNRTNLNPLAALNQPDSLFYDEIAQRLIIADSVAKKLFSFPVTVAQNGTALLETAEEFFLNPGTQVVAMARHGEEILLLDKGNSMIRVYDRNLHEIKTIGSRMGYILEYEDEQNLRLGFEFPEDMAVSEDGRLVLVSDSGNKRLVVLNKEGKQEKIIRLPEFPFKIIAWDEARDCVFVSDFDCSVMVVSLRYGYIDTIETNHPVDFFPTMFHPARHVVGSENNNEIVELTFEDTSLEEIAKGAENFQVLVKILADGNKPGEARELVKKHRELLPEYAAYTRDKDEYILAGLTGHVQETFHTLLEENQSLAENVHKQSVEFIKKYKSIPETEDSEAAHIDKENIRHRMFLDLKQYRRNLKGIGELSKVTAGYPSHLKLLGGLLNKRFDYLKPALLKSLEDIALYMDPLAEPEMLDTIVRYWMLAEERQVLFPEREIEKKQIFGGKFLLAILNDFYFNIAELYREKYKIDQYIAFCDREITLYTDKVNIFRQFVRHLIQWKKYDDVLRMLRKIPDQNKENINFHYYQVHLAKGDSNAAFKYLKRELDLFPHRVHLIPKLIRLNKKNSDDVEPYIDKLLEKSGQSIDTYLHVAQAFFNIGNFVQAESYVDRELKLFPENNTAVFLKLNLFRRHDVTSLSEDYFEEAWNIFKRFIRMNRDETAARQMLPFFDLLNHISRKKMDLHQLLDLMERVIFETYREELNIYISFIKHHPESEMSEPESFGGEIEKYENDVYLSAYSTSALAYRYFFTKVKALKQSGQWEEMFALTENILKYNPGSREIFEFLDNLSS